MDADASVPQDLFDEYRRGHAREHELERQALLKAEATMNLRLEGMNEFRAQLNQQQGTFVTRTEFEAAMRPLQKFNDRLGGMAVMVVVLAGLFSALITLLLRR